MQFLRLTGETYQVIICNECDELTNAYIRCPKSLYVSRLDMLIIGIALHHNDLDFKRWTSILIPTTVTKLLDTTIKQKELT